MKKDKILNVIVFSDTHCGCQVGLMPPVIHLAHGPTVRQSRFQRAIWERWLYFWDEWVPRVTRGEPYAVVFNGDALDGRHHGSTHQVTHDLSDQANIAYECLAPIMDKCQGRFYYVSGTPVHGGEAAEDEERLAQRLGVIGAPGSKRSTHFELFMKVGSALCHITHHIGVTSSMAYEGTALTKEATEFYAESARDGEPAPDIIVRSHRHRHFEVRFPTHKEYGYCVVTAGWQLKTPWLFKRPGGRVAKPKIGGSLIRQGDEEFYTRHKTWPTKRSRTITPMFEVK